MNKSNIEHFALFIIAGAAIHFVPWWLFLIGAALAIELDQARTWANERNCHYGENCWHIFDWFKYRDTWLDMAADFAAIGLISVIKYWVIK